MKEIGHKQVEDQPGGKCFNVNNKRVFNATFLVINLCVCVISISTTLVMKPFGMQKGNSCYKEVDLNFQ